MIVSSAFSYCVKNEWYIRIHLIDDDGKKIERKRKVPKTLFAHLAPDKIKAKCDAYAMRIAEGMATGDLPVTTAARGITVGSFRSIFINKLESRKLAPATISAYQTTYGRLETTLGANKQLRTLTQADVDRVCSVISSIGGPRYAQTKLNQLEYILDLARKHDATNRSFDILALARAQKKEMGYLTDDQYESFLQMARLHDGIKSPTQPYKYRGSFYLICILAGETGLRAGEVAGLCWADIDLENLTIRVHRKVGQNAFKYEPLKNKVARTISITSRLADYLKSITNKEGRLFPGSAADASQIGRYVYRLCIRQGVDLPKNLKPGLHCLRHTAAMRLIQAGATLHQVSQHLGHSSLLVTEQTYLHLNTSEGSKAAIDALDRARAQAQENSATNVIPIHRK